MWAAQVSIDGLRAIAERTGLYAGQDEPEFVENPDGTIKLCRVWRRDSGADPHCEHRQPQIEGAGEER